MFYASFLTFIFATTIDTTLLSPDYYNAALDDNRVYERVYTEVLADPELRDLTQDLLGGERAQEGAIVVSLLRTVLPPDALKSITEQTVAAIIAYLSGDTKRIDTRVDLNTVLTNLSKVAGQRAANLLVSARDEHQDSIDAFSTLLQQFVTDLENGSIPATIPSVDASSDTTKLVLDVLFGSRGLIPNPATRNQVQARSQRGRLARGTDRRGERDPVGIGGAVCHAAGGTPGAGTLS